MKKKFVKALVLILFAGFVACNDDDPAPQGIGDAYIISKLAPAEEEGEESAVVHGLHIEAGAVYGILSSVTVSRGATSYTLEKYTGTESNGFFYDQDDYDATLPAEGTYTFNYTFTTGETYTTTDALTDDVLSPANITTCTFSDDKIELEWDEVEDADATYVLLKDADGDIVFSSIVNTYLDGDETEYTISRSYGNWASGHTMTNGATYTVEVVAILGDNGGFFQAVSYGTHSVVWGVES
jgi:hypothetical protein